MSGCAHMNPDNFCASCAGEKLVAARAEVERLHAAIKELELQLQNAEVGVEYAKQLEAELGSAKDLVAEEMRLHSRTVREKEQAEARMREVVEALEIARPYVYHTIRRCSGGAITQVQKHYEQVSAALAAAQPEQHQPRSGKVESEGLVRLAAAQPEEEKK